MKRPRHTFTGTIHPLGVADLDPVLFFPLDPGWEKSYNPIDPDP
jgi:hypothetical protein